jgi:Putative prokaryotic signal transducing protein
MKRVFSSLNRAAVHHARNLLAAEGIRAEVRNELLAGALGQVPFTECEIELWVIDDADAWRAEEILRHGRSRPLEPASAWRCAVCGEHSEGQFTQCWRCGAFRRD